jgi:CRISPR/Cas system-associated exonuclease Cas4 (RecB family)
VRVPQLTQALEIGLQLQQGDRDESVLHVTDLAHTIGEGCPRQLWLRLRGADRKSLTAGQMLMFWHGHRIHADLTDLLKAGLPREWEIIEVELSMEFHDIVGTCDAIIHNTDTGECIVVDYKSLRSKAFSFLDHSDKPKPAHSLQVQTYCYGLEWAGLYYPDYSMVLYADREGQNFARAFAVARDNEYVKECIVEAKRIVSLPEPPPMLTPIVDITENKGPDSVKLRQPWQCDYCYYQDVTCHGALPYELRNLGIVGHFDGEYFKPKKDIPEEAIAYVIPELEPIPF